MAKIILLGDTRVRVAARLIALGAVFGIVLWLVTLALNNFVVEPITCGISGGTGQCSQALSVAGGIAGVFVAAAAIFAGIWWRISRPIFVAVSATLLLWGLPLWVDGLFWLEALAWSALVGILAYLLFGWINRTQSIAVTLIVTIVIIIAEHIALAL